MRNWNTGSPEEPVEYGNRCSVGYRRLERPGQQEKKKESILHVVAIINTVY